MKATRIAIVGGGIGGLVAALALHRAGAAVRVFESVREVRPLGVGINLLPHCVRILDGLGVLEPLLELGSPTQELLLFTRLGQQVWSEPRGAAAGYKWPQLAIHRGELQLALLAAVRERIGAENVRTGHHFQRFEQSATEVRAEFVDRASGKLLASETADILVAADGIHSSVRAQLIPGEGPPKWNGGFIWRGMAYAPQFLTGRSHVMVGGEQTFIAYPMAREPRADGMVLTNWVARIFVDPARGFEREDWNKRGELSDLEPLYQAWRFPWLDIPAIMHASGEIFEYPMVDRDPLENWTFGRVTLLGDAAHPMYPLGSNGASQAILDAQALADAFSARDPLAALAVYEAERRPKTARIVLSNRQGGPEVVLRIAEERAPHGFTDLEDVLPRSELEAISQSYKTVAGFDVGTVNR